MKIYFYLVKMGFYISNLIIVVMKIIVDVNNNIIFYVYVSVWYNIIINFLFVYKGLIKVNLSVWLLLFELIDYIYFLCKL